MIADWRLGPGAPGADWEMGWRLTACQRALPATQRNGLPQRRRDTEVEKKQMMFFFHSDLRYLCVRESF